jgi:thiamine-monophosphate kinase
VAIQLPASDRGVLLDFADGIGDAARAAGTVIVGGNLSAGDALGVTTTVLGSAFAPLSRAGAGAGDRLYVTGALGGPAAALRTLLSGGAPAPALRERLAAPAARIAEARWLAANGATAAIDISDGLAADARHLARASGVVVEIDAGSVPVFDGATPDDALAGGEEYELLVAAPAAPAAPAFDEDAFRRRFGVMLTPVGRIASGVSDVRLLEAGKRVAAPPGHDHFSR